jgi:hypothetical protein
MFTVHKFVLCFVITMKLLSTQFSHFQTQLLVPLLLNRCHTMALTPTGHLAYAPFFTPCFTPTPSYIVILPATSLATDSVHNLQLNRLILNLCVKLGILKYGFACVIEVLAVLPGILFVCIFVFCWLSSGNTRQVFDFVFIRSLEPSYTPRDLLH